MRTVVDASAVVDLLIAGTRGREVAAHLLATPSRDVPLTVAHMDAEVFSALARLHRDGVLQEDELPRLLDRLAAFAVERLPVSGSLLRAAWRRRHGVSARDALYVAAAEAVGARLLTTDQRLARAVPGLAVPL